MPKKTKKVGRPTNPESKRQIKLTYIFQQLVFFSI